MRRPVHGHWKRGLTFDKSTQTGLRDGLGLWSHLGPSEHPARQAHGTHRGHQRQPDFTDVALAKLADDRRDVDKLGRTPALFLGPRTGRPSTVGRGPLDGRPFEETTKPNHGAKFRKALDIARNEDSLERDRLSSS